MKTYLKSELEGKWIIAFDTVCDGQCCVLDDDENPCLFDSLEEAKAEIADSFEAMHESHLAEVKAGNITDPEDIEMFENEEPDEYPMPALEYVHNRKFFVRVDAENELSGYVSGYKLYLDEN